MSSNGTPEFSYVSGKFGQAYHVGNVSNDYAGLIYTTVSANSALDLGSGDFTIDFWVNFGSWDTSGGFMFGCLDQNGHIRMGLRYQGTSASEGFVTPFFNGLGLPGESANPAGGVRPSVYLNNAGWKHIAVVRNGSNFNIYVDGQSIYNYGSVSGSISPVGTCNFAIGQVGATAYQVGSYYPLKNASIDEFRISKGIARWTSNFVPPTQDRKSTRLNSSHSQQSRMPSSA